MKKILSFQLIVSLLFANNSFAQYNTLWIPDTLSGTTFNLNIKDTFSQLKAGQQTITAGINNDHFWGPTLFFNQGDTVHLNVRNSLNDSTTLHWHGMHLPAVMDGGPHQIIPPGTLWQPYWKVTNSAATYWYHPHLHEMTQEQITKGVGGLIIVRDSIEAALPLPRTYGVDDIPLVITDRTFTNSNQFSITAPYGDSLMVNGVLSPQYNIPAQVVRFRILNAAIERSYNLGFSDNRQFFVITSDGGLLNQPVAVTRYLLSAGERIEILINCTGENGTSIDLKSFNSTLTNPIPGGEVFLVGPFANALGRKDFTVLHLNIQASTVNPIVAIPTTLTTNIFPSVASSNITRLLTINDTAAINFPNVTILGPNAFVINRRMFSMSQLDYSIPLNNTEVWQITSTSGFAHPFHIHDVEFYILTRNGVAPPAYEQGWKDVVLVKSNETVRFIAKFDDYADNIHPFMYHCHISLHEDEGMMGQFVVGDGISAASVTSLSCGTATFSAAAFSDNIYSAVATIPYTGGNGMAYANGNVGIPSTGVTGLTATLQSGNLSTGNGNLFYSVVGTPSSAGTANFAIDFGGQTCTLSLNVGISNTNTGIPAIDSLKCDQIVFSSMPYVNTYYTGTVTIGYTGGNGAAYTPIGNALQSTGVQGLTMYLHAGTLANGSGNFVMTIYGTADSSGIAYFTFRFAGRTCTIAVNVISKFDLKLLPNPVDNILYATLYPFNAQAYYLWLLDAAGRIVYMMPQPDLSKGIDVSNLSKGIYFIRVMDQENKMIVTKRFLKK